MLLFEAFGEERGARRLALVLLSWTWCLPNTLLSVAGAALALATGGRAAPYRGAVLVRVPWMRAFGGVCLGSTILVSPTFPEHVIRHEWGHFRQHLRLGPLYHLVIGLPSVSHALWHMVHPTENYFAFYTEAWADELGGVYAEHGHGERTWWSYLWAPALVAATVALTLAAFAPALGWGFTDADALADVAWAGRPLSEQLLVPLTGGVAEENANFWRPAAMLQFWVERRFFGWEPRGWHAWDLAMHVAASLAFARLAFVAARALGLPARAFTTAVTLLFVAHPLAEEVVPANARNIDTLLGLASFAALARFVAWQEARAAGGRGLAAWAGWAGLFLVALATKESALLLLGVAAVWVVLARPGLEWGRRGAEVAWGVAPLVVPVVGWWLVRQQVLGGEGGYYSDPEQADRERWLWDALERGFVEPFLPALSGVLRPLRGTAFQVGTALFWLGLGGLLSRTRWWRPALWGMVWLAASVLLHGVTGTYNRRVLYVPTGAALLVVGAALAATWEARGRWTGRLGALLGLAWLGTWAWGSPAVSRYPDWGEQAKASAPFLRVQTWEALAPETRVYLVDRPYRVDLDPRRFRLWGGRSLGLVHGPPAYAVEAWVDEHLPALDLRFETVSTWFLREPVAAQQVEVTLLPDGVSVTRKGGTRGVVGKPRVATHTDEATGAFTVRWEGNPRKRVAFAVWAGDRVELWAQ